MVQPRVQQGVAGTAAITEDMPVLWRVRRSALHPIAFPAAAPPPGHVGVPRATGDPDLRKPPLRFRRCVSCAADSATGSQSPTGGLLVTACPTSRRTACAAAGRSPDHAFISRPRWRRSTPGPEVLPDKVALSLTVHPRQVHRTLTLDVSDHLRHRVLRRDQVPFLDATLLLHSQPAENFPQVLPHLLV
jgi:hypothetical protein